MQKKLIWNICAKNVNINVQWTRFPNLYAQNNPGQVDMTLKSVIGNIYANKNI